jgi:RNA recognition motif-containing protein
MRVLAFAFILVIFCASSVPQRVKKNTEIYGNISNVTIINYENSIEKNKSDGENAEEMLKHMNSSIGEKVREIYVNFLNQKISIDKKTLKHQHQLDVEELNLRIQKETNRLLKLHSNFSSEEEDDYFEQNSTAPITTS